MYILLTVVPVLWKGMESEGEGVGGRVLKRHGLRRGRVSVGGGGGSRRIRGGGDWGNGP